MGAQRGTAWDLPARLNAADPKAPRLARKAAERPAKTGERCITRNGPGYRPDHRAVLRQAPRSFLLPSRCPAA